MSRVEKWIVLHFFFLVTILFKHKQLWYISYTFLAWRTFLFLNCKLFGIVCFAVDLFWIEGYNTMLDAFLRFYARINLAFIFTDNLQTNENERMQRPIHRPLNQINKQPSKFTKISYYYYLRIIYNSNMICTCH